MELYNHLDQQLHQLCQVIARFNRTYVPRKEDDSHTNLYYDSIGDRITGRWVESSKGKVMLSLGLGESVLMLNDHSQKVLFRTSVKGKKQNEIEEEVSRWIVELRLSPEDFRDPMHFEIPDYGFSDKPTNEFDAQALNVWGKYRGMANRACNLLMGHLQINSEVRI